MPTQRWQKLGQVFCAENQHPWMATHASCPVGLSLDERMARIFFSPRDQDNKSSIAWLDAAIDPTGFSIVRLCDRPMLGPGALGAFDDNGVTVGCVVPCRNELRVYYLGWTLRVTVPFNNFIGLAVGRPDALTLERAHQAPIVDRSPADPFTLSYPWVLETQHGWRMWYGSHLSWDEKPDELGHVLKQAHSADGLRWERDGSVAIDVARPREFALTRPCVLGDPDRYRIWFSRRAPGYALGYAESVDGKTWARDDSACGLKPSSEGWDSESVEYASVFDHAGARFMVYNGNGYGRSGFGLAVLEGWGTR